MTHVVLLNKNCPFAAQEAVHLSDLKELFEIVLGDPTMPAMPTNDARKELPGDNAYRQIKVFERISQIELIKTMPHAFAWSLPFRKSGWRSEIWCNDAVLNTPKPITIYSSAARTISSAILILLFGRTEKTTHFDI